MIICPYCRRKIVSDKLPKMKPQTLPEVDPALFIIPNVKKKRVTNIEDAYSVDWDRKSIKITIMGIGDKPAFTIDGIYQGIYFPVKVRFHTHTPGGGQSRLYYWDKNDKRHVISKANLRNAKVSIDNMMKNLLKINLLKI